MPVFEFRCQACEATHEVIVLPSEERPDVCPDCGGELKRLWSRVGVQLVGWGFSRTDGYLGGRKPSANFKALRDKASELFD